MHMYLLFNEAIHPRQFLRKYVFFSSFYISDIIQPLH